MRTTQGTGSSQVQSTISSLLDTENDDSDELMISSSTSLCGRSPLADYRESGYGANGMKNEKKSETVTSTVGQLDSGTIIDTANLFRLFNETLDDLKGRGNTEMADAMNNVCDVVIHLMKVVVRDSVSGEPLDVGELVQHESKALIDCGRSAEMLDLVRIIEPLGDLLRRVQMHQNDDQEPKDSSYDSYIPSSPEFTDDTTAISAGSRDKENEENTEADLDIAMANRLPPEEEGVSANDTHDSDHETAVMLESTGTSLRELTPIVIAGGSVMDSDASLRKIALRRPLCKRQFDNSREISCFGDLANTGEASTPKRARCGIPSVMSEPVLSLMGKAPTSSCSLSSLNSVKSVSFDLDSSRVKIFEKTANERMPTEPGSNTDCVLNVTLTEFKELFPTGSAKMPEDSPGRQTKEPEKFIFVKKVVRRLSKKVILQRLQADFRMLDTALTTDLPLKNWLIADSVLELMNEKCFLDWAHAQGSLISRVHYPQVDPQDILDSLRELNSLPCGMVVYLAIGYDWATERETLMKFENTYRHIISTLKRMLLAGYTSAIQIQAKTSQEYDLQMEMKKGAKKRSLQRGGRMWMPPPRLFLITIPSDDSDETTQARCEAINEMMSSLTTNSYDGSSSSEDEQIELDPYMDVGRVHAELLDWRQMCEEEGAETQKDRVKLLMEHLRLERGVLMKAVNR